MTMSMMKRTLMSAGVLLLCARAASAGTPFLDDFNDRNAQDGSPVTWVPSAGTWDASSGDYVVTGSIPRLSRVTAQVFTNTSARAQVRVTGNIEAGIGLRREPLFGYAGVIRPDGSMTIARLDGAPPVALVSAVVPFNPVTQDVLLQFDAIGNRLSLWAWPLGQSMPTEPQVVVVDNTYAQGPVGLISAGFTAVESDATTFRFVQVAETHIVPEPAAFLLLSLAGCGVLSARRRKRC